ncbi:MAG: hypothetical protein JF587_13025 [Catenulisporales bacterium]|nr:hypothetical protein [Catenulisporales bacterium]
MLLAAAGIGIGHAVLPDHWMPLAVLARTRRYPTRKVLRLALAAAVTHVVVSVLLGAALIAVGLRFRETVARHADLAVGGVLIATGVALLVMEALGRGHAHAHEHHDHDHHDHDHRHHDHRHAERSHHGPAHPTTDHGHTHAVAVLERPLATASPHPHGRRTLLAFLVPFGAVASPDLTILPLFLAAGALGVAPALGVLAAFAAATIIAIAGLTTATALGAARLTAPWIEQRANALTAATLLVIGVLVVGGML